MATLFLVATPIGNLSDLSPRAVDTLRSVRVIAAEDTRRTRKLLTAMGIPAPRLIAYHEHEEKTQARELVGLLDAGENLVLVSDSGTPAISDPGYRVVCLAIEHGHEIIPIPGPNAAIALLSVSGLPTDRFLFVGFPPQKGGARRRFIEELAAERGTVLMHESPNRLGRLLAEMAEVLGPHRRVAIGRELTKLHEEVIRGTVSELAERFAKENVAGEVVIALEGDREKRLAPTREALDEEIDRALEEEGLSVRDASDALARKLGVPRKQVYRRALERAGRKPAAGAGSGGS